MSFESIVTFWAAMIWHTLRIMWRRAKALFAEKVRRYGDRYYRVGRHSTRALGLMHSRRANDLVSLLRNERPLFMRMHADTETLVLM